MADVIFNKGELILDRVRSLTAHDLTTGEMLFRLTSLEDPSLQTSSESEEVVDAIGALITNLYRAKRATFSASNSLISLDLAAAQFGTKKEIASSTDKIVVPTYEIIKVKADQTTVELKNVAVGNIDYIYHLADGEIATSYKMGATASATEFAFGEDKKTITVPTGLTGSIYVEYSFESEKANRVVNKSDKFPEACGIKIYAYFRDKCNENLVYSGVIVADKAKLSPESVELALTSTGKHPFEFTMLRDYCEESADLFSIIVAE